MEVGYDLLKTYSTRWGQTKKVNEHTFNINTQCTEHWQDSNITQVKVIGSIAKAKTNWNAQGKTKPDVWPRLAIEQTVEEQKKTEEKPHVLGSRQFEECKKSFERIYATKFIGFAAAKSANSFVRLSFFVVAALVFECLASLFRTSF